MLLIQPWFFNTKNKFKKSPITTFVVIFSYLRGPKIQKFSLLVGTNHGGVSLHSHTFSPPVLKTTPPPLQNDVNDINLVSLLLTFNRLHTFILCFRRWLWASKCWISRWIRERNLFWTRALTPAHLHASTSPPELVTFH